MRKIFVIGNKDHNANWMQGEIVKRLEDADLVVFTGGEDVTPSYYNEPKNPKTYCNPARDEREAEIFKLAQKLGKHIIGICRGSQFTCVMSGGRLVQHQSNPQYMHHIETSTTKDPIIITSTHHQAMYPYDMNPEDYKLLAWTEGISPMHEDGNGEEMGNEDFLEAEICYFPKTKVLGIQGHPELMNPAQYPATFEYLRGLLDAHMNDAL